MQKTILSLFDYSGNWPKYYKEAGYNVLQVDIKYGIDILKISARDLPNQIHGILAAPPCTDFAGSGAQYWKQKDQDGRTDASLKLVDKVLQMVDYYNPEFWALEIQ